jgi:GAF domain-containing protein
LLSTPAIEEVLRKLAVLAVQSVDAGMTCGITVRYDHSPYTVAASDERAWIIDEQQYAAGGGPCLEALRTGSAVSVDDQAADDRWPEYRVAAVALGVKSSLSLPLTVDEQTLGALNLYAYATSHAFAGDRSDRAEAFAEQAATTLALAIRHTEQEETVEQLEAALDARSLIDQAVGILMGQQRCDAQVAFRLLRRHSQNTNRKLRDVATDIIERYSGHRPVPSAKFQRGSDNAPGANPG